MQKHVVGMTAQVCDVLRPIWSTGADCTQRAAALLAAQTSPKVAAASVILGP